MSLVNHQILLASRPAAEPTIDNFQLVEAPVPSPTSSARGRCWCATITSRSTPTCAAA